MKDRAKLPKKKVTVADLLDKDTVRSIAQSFFNELDDIEDVVIIFSKNDDLLHCLRNTVNSRTVYLLEAVKHDLFIEETSAS